MPTFDVQCAAADLRASIGDVEKIFNSLQTTEWGAHVHAELGDASCQKTEATPSENGDDASQEKFEDTWHGKLDNTYKFVDAVCEKIVNTSTNRKPRNRRGKLLCKLQASVDCIERICDKLDRPLQTSKYGVVSRFLQRARKVLCDLKETSIGAPVPSFEARVVKLLRCSNAVFGCAGELPKDILEQFKDALRDLLESYAALQKQQHKSVTELLQRSASLKTQLSETLMSEEMDLLDNLQNTLRDMQKLTKGQFYEFKRYARNMADPDMVQAALASADSYFQCLEKPTKDPPNIISTIRALREKEKTATEAFSECSNRIASCAFPMRHNLARFYETHSYHLAAVTNLEDLRHSCICFLDSQQGSQAKLSALVVRAAKVAIKACAKTSNTFNMYKKSVLALLRSSPLVDTQPFDDDIMVCLPRYANENLHWELPFFESALRSLQHHFSKPPDDVLALMNSLSMLGLN